VTSSPLLLPSVCLFFGLLIVIGRKLSSGPTDIVMLFVFTFGLFYGFRPLLMALGLDTPFPDRYFDMATAASLAAVSLMWLSAFLACFAVGCYVMYERVAPAGSLFFARRQPSLTRMLWVTSALTLLASVISVAMVARFGGVGGFITAVKVEKSLAGLYFLKLPAAVGSVVAVATYLQVRSTRNLVLRGAGRLALACAVIDGFGVFIWGQRSTLVILGVMFLLGLSENSTVAARPARVAVRVVLAVAIVISVSLGLRIARDTLIGGQVQAVVAKSNLWRQMSIGTNSIYFDSSMLAFRDWPALHDYRAGADFGRGAAGLVPRIAWEGKPDTVVAGKWFRQVYQPDIVNGWPVGTPTLWWLNFGPLGILIGGLLSGLWFGWMRRAQRNSAVTGLNTGIAMVAAIYVFELGLGAEWPVGFLPWVLPLWLTTVFVTRRGDARSPVDRHGVMAEARGN
jgi:hypothetical protein